MRYKREEAFRYAFDPPLEAYFSIIEVNGQTIDVPEGPARLLDLSTHGLKFSSDLDIPMSENDTISVSVRFSINESEYKINGEVAWRKQESKRCFFYGIHLFADERLQQALTQELIVFSRSVNS
ncbi:hypothetical protein JOD43_002977 [Pullulanibacillus pueri]|nr:PilZ domain-containing protein [Pullulanibacillus pueri]MBM7682798.1 hypothetical protein [Pullulanibacillus pueri]